MSASEPCARCGALGDDRRTLWMACLYRMSELGVPFEEFAIHGVILTKCGRDPTWGSPLFEDPPSRLEDKAQSRPFYTLTVCKGCRGAWLDAIQEWFRAPIHHAVRFNNDSSDRFPEDTLPQLVAELEAKTRELEGLKQRYEFALANGRAELDRRAQHNVSASPSRLPEPDS